MRLSKIILVTRFILLQRIRIFLENLKTSFFIISFIYAYLSSKMKKVTVNELMKSADVKLVINNFNARKTGEDRVYSPQSDSSSGSSGGGGGGGGGGSGGGHRF